MPSSSSGRSVVVAACSSQGCALHFSSPNGIVSIPHLVGSAVWLLAMHSTPRTRLPVPHVFEHCIRKTRNHHFKNRFCLYKIRQMNLIPRSSEPFSRTVAHSSLASGHVIVPLWRITQSLIHSAHSRAIDGAAENQPRLNSLAAVGRTLDTQIKKNTRHTY